MKEMYIYVLALVTSSTVEIAVWSNIETNFFDLCDKVWVISNTLKIFRIVSVDFGDGSITLSVKVWACEKKMQSVVEM